MSCPSDRTWRAASSQVFAAGADIAQGLGALAWLKLTFAIIAFIGALGREEMACRPR